MLNLRKTRAGPWAGCVLLSLLFHQPAAHAAPLKVPDGPVLSRSELEALRRAEVEARKWGMDVPHPGLRFDASQYGPSGGVREALVILIDFPDNQGSISPGDIEALLFSKGVYPTGSLRDYYEENSCGKLEVRGKVVGWLRSQREYAYYVDGGYGLNFWNGDRNARGMAEEAIRLADPYVDFSQFDNDGPDGVPSSGDDDGYVDALMIVHAGPGAEETGSRADIRSHQGYFLDDIAVDGVRAILYTTEPEDGKVGVFCHEFGHTLGLPDLYDLSGVGAGLGRWTLMAAGVWNDGGRTPAHLDAWCKALLGFVEPEVPVNNAPDLRLAPAEGCGIGSDPLAYVLWTNGRPASEYFIVEARERVGFDSHLPAEGVLIYHVDESVRLQNNPDHYMIDLEQADGLRDLNKWIGNEGDSGDPFPGATGNAYFGLDTAPSSQAWDGSDSQVSLARIAAEQGAFRFDLQVENRPEFVLELAEATDTDGGRLEPGEAGAVNLTVRNVGLGAEAVEASLVSLDPRVAVLGSSVPAGDVDGDTKFQVQFRFTQVPPDGAVVELPFRLELRSAGMAIGSLQFSVGAGIETGFSDDFEVPSGWSHEPATDGWADAWELSQSKARSGSNSWAFGGKGGYPNFADGALVSPPILLAPNSQLVFYQWVKAESLGSTLAWDGGRVEISHMGGPWTPLEPYGGYDFRLVEFSETPIARGGVLSGLRTWNRVSMDLSDYTGLARIRFRFVSDGSIVGEGWYVDDVTVLSRGYDVRFVGLWETDGAVKLSLEVTPLEGAFDGRGFNVYRKTEGERAEDGDGQGPVRHYKKLTSSPLFPDGTGGVVFLDKAVKPAKTYLYVVEDLGPPGASPTYLGPQRIALPAVWEPISTGAPYPSPFRPGDGSVVKLFVRLRESSGWESRVVLAVRIFDAQGRSVRDLGLITVRVPTEITLGWDGRGEGGEVVPAGVYFWQVAAMGQCQSRKLVVVR